MIQTGILGDHAEKLALKYLKKQNLTPYQKNYYCQYGEIDLIMWDQQYLVFVEVRYRKTQNFGGALASIDQFKQAKLRRSAEHYLIRTKNTDCPCRFDILCLNGNLNNPDFHWIKNAF
jgi:putative endonuclease